MNLLLAEAIFQYCWYGFGQKDKKIWDMEWVFCFGFWAYRLRGLIFSFVQEAPYVFFPVQVSIIFFLCETMCIANSAYIRQEERSKKWWNMVGHVAALGWTQKSKDRYPFSP
jgi:hypothetical protein